MRKSKKNGNTEILLTRCVEIFKRAGIQSELFSFADIELKPCKACGVCRKIANRWCAITDDDFHTIFQSMCDSQIIISASPVYFGSATPNLIALLDRAGYVSSVADTI